MSKGRGGGTSEARPGEGGEGGEGSERNCNALSFGLRRVFAAGTEALDDRSRRVCLTREGPASHARNSQVSVDMQRAGVGAAHSRAGHDQREGCAGGRGVRRRRLSKHWQVVYT
jgi:hypothetical protein